MGSTATAFVMVGNTTVRRSSPPAKVHSFTVRSSEQVATMAVEPPAPLCNPTTGKVCSDQEYMGVGGATSGLYTSRSASRDHVLTTVSSLAVNRSESSSVKATAVTFL
eukprot:3985255-Pyramimonas_sp.AAC.1